MYNVIQCICRVGKLVRDEIFHSSSISGSENDYKNSLCLYTDAPRSLTEIPLSLIDCTFEGGQLFLFAYVQHITHTLCSSSTNYIDNLKVYTPR